MLVKTYDIILSTKKMNPKYFFYQEGYFTRFAKKFSSWSRLFLAILIVSIYFQWYTETMCPKGMLQHIAKTKLFFGFFVLFLVILIVSIFSEMLKQCAKRACYNTLQKHDLLTALPFEDNKFDCLISVAVTTYLSKYFLKINGKA